MQQYKTYYSDESYYNTFSNVQKCLRLNDWKDIGDKTHYLVFDMIGLFSFQQWSLKQGVDFMWRFLNKIGITPDYVTIHPDKLSEWSYLYQDYDVIIKEDSECIWGDGNIQGYCTEFYKNDIEIGNIVNTLGKSIDIGFGLERLLTIIHNKDNELSKLNILENTYFQLLKDNFIIGNKNQGHIMKKIVIECVLLGSKINDDNFNRIRNNILKNYSLYLKKSSHSKFINKDKSFWIDTFGIDIDRLDDYKNICII